MPLVWHAGVDPLQSVSDAQARHVFDVASQMGVEPLQSALLRHCTQVVVATLQWVLPETVQSVSERNSRVVLVVLLVTDLLVRLTL